MRPSPSLIVSSLALVVATGGTSYAAVKISSSDIQNDTVRSIDVKDDNLRSKDVKDGTLKAKDLRKGQISKEATRWALVDADGEIVAQSGGFSVAAAYPTLPNTANPPAPDNSLRANGNVYIDANENLSNNAVIATISLQNAVDQNGDGIMSGRAPGADANPEFSGEISTAMCGQTGVVACAPAGTNNNEHLVVSPRDSDGSFTTAGERKRFYVVVTGDSRDRVAP